MEIKSLHLIPELFSTLARWAYDEWYSNRDIDLDLVMKTYCARSNNVSLPQTFVAMEEGQPLGMVTLKLDDLWSRKDLNPWLSSLFVIPGFRGNGIGAALISTVTDRAVGMGFKDLYLFLGQSNRDRLERFYTKQGWEIIGSEPDNDGMDTKILRFKLK